MGQRRSSDELRLDVLRRLIRLQDKTDAVHLHTENTECDAEETLRRLAKLQKQAGFRREDDRDDS